MTYATYTANKISKVKYIKIKDSEMYPSSIAVFVPNSNPKISVVKCHGLDDALDILYSIIGYVHVVGGGLYRRKWTFRAGGAASNPLGWRSNAASTRCTTLWIRRSRMPSRSLSNRDVYGSDSSAVI